MKLSLALLLIILSVVQLPAVPEQEMNTVSSLRKAIEFLMETYGDAYPHGADYLARLDELGDNTGEAYTDLQREALLNHQPHSTRHLGGRNVKSGREAPVVEKELI